MANIVYLGEIVTGDKLSVLVLIVRDPANAVTGLMDFSSGFDAVPTFIGKTVDGTPISLNGAFSGAANDGKITFSDPTNGISLGSKERVRVTGQAKYVKTAGSSPGYSKKASYDVIQAANWTG